VQQDGVVAILPWLAVAARLAQGPGSADPPLDWRFTVAAKPPRLCGDSAKLTIIAARGAMLTSWFRQLRLC
jgi:hypothetical protein